MYFSFEKIPFSLEIFFVIFLYQCSVTKKSNFQVLPGLILDLKWQFLNSNFFQGCGHPVVVLLFQLAVFKVSGGWVL